MAFLKKKQPGLGDVRTLNSPIKNKKKKRPATPQTQRDEAATAHFEPVTLEAAFPDVRVLGGHQSDFFPQI